MKKLFFALPILLLGHANAPAACDNPIETAQLYCNAGELLVIAKICDDVAELKINGKFFVLPRSPKENLFFENSDASYITDDLSVGFVINHNDPNFATYEGRYLLKVNGNEYPVCKQVDFSW